MARINLSIDEELFNLLVEDANKHNCTVNVYLISLLEKLYKQDPFDYAAALEALEKEAKAKPVNADFILCELPSFDSISVAKAKNAGLQPSVVRARIGKMFNTRVAEGAVGTVERSMDKDGNLKFRSRAAVYVRK